MFVYSLLARMAAERPSGRKYPPGSDGLSRETSPTIGHNLASRTGDQDRNWDGEVYASYNLGFLAQLASVRLRAGHDRLRGHFHKRQRACAPLSPRSIGPSCAPA